MAGIEPHAEGTRLLHIGPPKTATTSIQASFHASRAALAEHSVVYAGNTRHARAPATAIAMEKLSVEFSPAALRAWEALAQEIRESEARVTVLSSEGLSYANHDRASRIVDQLGGTPHVAITMRSPARMVPSVWQQRVRRGSAQSLDAWLQQIFDRDGDGKFTANQYWGRFGLDRLIDTWAGVVGAANVSVVILDPNDHAMAHHSFEDLVSVPRGTLKHVRRMANESFPYGELETIRHFNELFYAAGGTRKEWLATIRRRGFTEFRQVDAPQLAGPKAEVPRWVAEQANAVATEWIGMLDSFGGQVLGDPAHLLVDASRYSEDTTAPQSVPVASAGLLAHILYDAARQAAVSSGSRPRAASGKATSGADAPRAAVPPVPAKTLRRRIGKAVRALRDG